MLMRILGNKKPPHLYEGSLLTSDFVFTYSASIPLLARCVWFASIKQAIALPVHFILTLILTFAW
jgi:hypothetical protein